MIEWISDLTLTIYGGWVIFVGIWVTFFFSLGVVDFFEKVSELKNKRK